MDLIFPAAPCGMARQFTKLACYITPLYNWSWDFPCCPCRSYTICLGS